MGSKIMHYASRLGTVALVMTVTVVVAAPRSGCWMTGGGSILVNGFAEYGGQPRITHGFELDCVPRKSDNLQVNDHVSGWSFHLGNVDFADCIDSAAIEPNPPDADFDTYIGRGTGICRNTGGESRNCSASWVFTDGGEIGGCLRDTAVIEVIDNDGTQLFTIAGDVDCGNHQAHSKRR